MNLRELTELKEDDLVEHRRFGQGKIISVEGNADEPSTLKANIQFESGKKRLMLPLAKLKKVL